MVTLKEAMMGKKERESGRTGGFREPGETERWRDTIA